MRLILMALAICLMPALTTAGTQADSNVRDAQELNGKLVITGSSTVAPLVSEIAKRFEARHSDVRIDVQMGGSSRGISDVRQKISDIGMVSRALKENEKDIIAFPIALDGITMIVHESNPIDELTNEEIIDIYTGKIKNWSEVGGNDAPITVVSKAEGRGTLDLFTKYFQIRSSDIRPHVIIGDNEQGVKTVSGNKNSIGFVSVGTAEYDAGIGIPIKPLPLNGVMATTESIRSGNFPLSRKLNLVTNAKPDELAEEFIEFANSNEVADIIEEQYFVTTIE